jgi:hypothetical protein
MFDEVDEAAMVPSLLASLNPLSGPELVPVIAPYLTQFLAWYGEENESALMQRIIMSDEKMGFASSNLDIDAAVPSSKRLPQNVRFSNRKPIHTLYMGLYAAGTGTGASNGVARYLAGGIELALTLEQSMENLRVGALSQMYSFKPNGRHRVNFDEMFADLFLLLDALYAIKQRTVTT